MGQWHSKHASMGGALPCSNSDTQLIVPQRNPAKPSQAPQVLPLTRRRRIKIPQDPKKLPQVLRSGIFSAMGSIYISPDAPRHIVQLFYLHGGNVLKTASDPTTLCFVSNNKDPMLPTLYMRGSAVFSAEWIEASFVAGVLAPLESFVLWPWQYKGPAKYIPEELFDFEPVDNELREEDKRKAGENGGDFSREGMEDMGLQAELTASSGGSSSLQLPNPTRTSQVCKSGTAGIKEVTGEQASGIGKKRKDPQRGQLQDLTNDSKKKAKRLAVHQDVRSNFTDHDPRPFAHPEIPKKDYLKQPFTSDMHVRSAGISFNVDPSFTHHLNNFQAQLATYLTTVHEPHHTSPSRKTLTSPQAAYARPFSTPAAHTVSRRNVSNRGDPSSSGKSTTPISTPPKTAYVLYQR